MGIFADWRESDLHKSRKKRYIKKANSPGAGLMPCHFSLGGK